MNVGILLYGAPATGKDTVTAALSRLDSRYRLYERLKVGPGRTTGYRMTTASEFDALQAAGNLIWQNQRYRARYGIDRHGLSEIIDAHAIPVVHAGQPEVITAVTEAFSDVEWTIVTLRCSRETAVARIIDRATGDTSERLKAWDETPVIPTADLTIDTSTTTPDAAAALIHRRSLA
ncbi:AAA family ATPase [Nocardia niwae]|uniref:AAA family ATPase n=2 Tax=Nocardia niwae TaxID=626084 RepID=A0ABV2XL04_9NOCA